ncbi:sperm-associated antigen 5 isoform X1 [Peromyscus maniculatus bairdii]|uniref:sperm-associated antigen 5 isoform X1 n=1 Tax=Peromyscus maniculatus bairdii TaxID=230844 RepID=UPI001C2EF123|nr:sperm-associated antigen 5 isoform X2 [Peromyscus maniculatus bairdii]
MWRVKTLNLGLSPSPQPERRELPRTGHCQGEASAVPRPEKTAMRTPLRELRLQPGALTDSGKGPPMFSTLTPYLRKLELKERSNNSSPVDFFNTENSSPVDFIKTENNFLSEQFSHPSEYMEACQYESDLAPEGYSPLSASEKAAATPDDVVVEPTDESMLKTMVLLPFPPGQQQDLMPEAPLEPIAEKNSSSLTESLGLEDLVAKEVAPCVEGSFSEVVAVRPEQPTFQDPPSHGLEDSFSEVVAVRPEQPAFQDPPSHGLEDSFSEVVAVRPEQPAFQDPPSHGLEDSFSEVVAVRPEQPTFQDPPSHGLEDPPKPCPEQFHCSEENLRGINTEAAPEDFVPSGNALNFSVAWLSPSAALTDDFPVDHVDAGEETVECRVIQEKEKSFPTSPEGVELGHQALAANAEDVPSVCLTSSPVELGPQEAPDSAVEDARRIPGLESEAWMSPLAWLEKGVTTSVMLQNLRQRLSFPSVLQDAAVGNTPLSTCSVGTSFTPPVPPEVGTKHSTSETERLPLGCGPLDLTALSRHDLEENLLNSLVVLEALSHQLQAWKRQLSVPPRESQDRSTQTDCSACGVTKTPKHLQDSKESRQALLQARHVMSWVLVSRELISLLHLSLAHMDEDRMTVSQESQHAETVVSSCSRVLKKLRAKLQSLQTEREEARHKEEMALKGKAAAEAVLEAFRAHASQRISQLEQELTSMQEFRGLLQKAQTQLIELHTEQEALAQQTVSLTSALQQDWTAIQLDYGTWAALLSRSRELTEKLTTKSRQALQERDAAVKEKKQVSKKLEQVSAHLEDCKGRIEQLELENSHLTTELEAKLQILTSTDRQLKELQSQHAHCVQDLATKDELLCQLTQSNREQAAQWQREEAELRHTQAELQRQKAVLAKEVQDLKETLEFADQESQVAHLELGQIECQLKATLEVLRERSLQCENQKDTVENLKAELASTVAKHEKESLEKTYQHSQELRLLTEQLQSLALFLQAKLKENRAEPEIVLPSTGCAPAQEHPLPADSTVSENTLTVVADEEPEPVPIPLLGSGESAFTRVASTTSLRPAETPDLEKSRAEVSTVLLELQRLCSLLQESKEEAVEALQRQICDLQTRLQDQEEEHQEAQKAKEADVEKLNQALCLCYKNEKELQEVIQKQNEKLLGQIDRNGELISLREEVTQLTRLLRHAETETKVLQEALEGQLDPSCQLMATEWIQEKVSLSQEVDKLRVMCLELKNEKAKLVVKYQSHRNILEENLRRSDTELKKLDDTIQQIYETLLSVPEVVKNCKELQGLLEFLS